MIPIARTARAGTGIVSTKEDIPFGPGPLKGLRVLVAEDDAWVAHHVAVTLEEEGARLIGPCSSVADARRLLDEQPVGFVLIDLSLADNFADDLVDDVRARGIPFAIITAFQALPTNSYDGAEYIFIKPINRQKLVAMLSRFT